MENRPQPVNQTVTVVEFSPNCQNNTLFIVFKKKIINSYIKVPTRLLKLEEKFLSPRLFKPTRLLET